MTTAQNITPIEIAHALPAVGLTPDDLATLRKPFAPNEHEFLRGFTYITESAVTNRLDDVDPSWSLVILNQAVRDNQAVVTVRLTVKGVGRDGVGMQTINDKAGEAEKGAATDALKRAARLFGIGRYLLDIPPGVGDMPGLTKWLNTKFSNVPAPKTDRRMAQPPKNGKVAPPGVDAETGEIEFSSADIEAAMKEAPIDWHGYRIDKTTGGTARVVMKDKGEKAAAIEAIAARGIRVIDNAVLANYFDTDVRIYAEPR